MEKTLEWYLERLPREIEFKWVATFGAPYTYNEPDEFHEIRCRWSIGEYPYTLRIYKDEDNRWVAHYVLEGYDGDSVCTMPECDILSEEMIKENNEWIRFEKGHDICAKETFTEAIVSLWNWLVSKNLVSNE